MGTPAKPESQKVIEEEHKQYGDIIQGDFMEAYKNLTLKGIMALKWISQYCRQAGFTIKVWKKKTSVTVFDEQKDEMCSNVFSTGVPLPNQ